MDEYDVAIVGGGPSGCFIAWQLASKGRTVAVVEEHHTIGEPVHCAGLITQRVFDITTISHKGILQNTINGAVIHSPNSHTLAIGGDKTHGLVIDRRKFDLHLSQEAQKAGTTLLLGHKSVNAKKQHNHIQLHLQHNTQPVTIRCTLLIGADGSRSHLRDLFGFPKPQETLQGIGAELSDTTLDPRVVHIILGQKIAPGFFAWIIPTNTHGTTARIGLCIARHGTQPLHHYFTNLHHHPLLQGATIIKKFGGTIPLGPLKKTASDHIMLVGDAAAQVKPTSGGGLYPGMIAATHCSTIADEAFQTHNFNEQFLRRYHMKWTKEIGRELSLGMRFRNTFIHLTDTQLNKYLEKLNKKKTLAVINTYGDIDYPSRLALPLLKAQPSLLSLAPRMLRQTKTEHYRRFFEDGGGGGT